MKAPAACIALVSVGFAAAAPSALADSGLLQTVTTPVTQTVQTAAQTAAPVTETTVQVVAPVTQTAAQVVQPVAATAAPVTETASTAVAPVVQAVAETAAPVVQPVAETAAPVVQPVAETAAPVLKPVADAVAPIADATAPVVKTAAPLVEAAAPLLEAAKPVLAGARPVVEATQPLLDATAPLVKAGAPLVDAASSLVDTSAPLLPSARETSSSPSKLGTTGTTIGQIPEVALITNALAEPGLTGFDEPTPSPITRVPGLTGSSGSNVLPPWWHSLQQIAPSPGAAATLLPELLPVSGSQLASPAANKRSSGRGVPLPAPPPSTLDGGWSLAAAWSGGSQAPVFVALTGLIIFLLLLGRRLLPAPELAWRSIPLSLAASPG